MQARLRLRDFVHQSSATRSVCTGASVFDLAPSSRPSIPLPPPSLTSENHLDTGIEQPTFVRMWPLNLKRAPCFSPEPVLQSLSLLVFFFFSLLVFDVGVKFFFPP